MSKSLLDPTLAAGEAVPSPELVTARTSPLSIATSAAGVAIVGAMLALSAPLAIAKKVMALFGYEGQSVTPKKLVETILSPATGVSTDDFTSLLLAAIAATILCAFLWALWGVAGILTGGRGGAQRLVAAVAALVVLVAVIGILL
jgi:hypothetical protein